MREVETRRSDLYEGGFQMFEIREGTVKINDVVVDTFERNVVEKKTVLTVEAGTTGYKGSCSRDAGCRTYLNILCLSGDFYFAPIQDEAGNNVGVTIACCGDDGLDAIMKVVDFAREVIDDQRCEVND
jgi:hypothetical protein